MNYLRYQSPSQGASATATTAAAANSNNDNNNNNFFSSSSEHANASSTTTTGLPLGLRTPSRVKRARYNVDPPEMHASGHQEQQQRQQESQTQQQQQRATMSTSVGAGGVASSSYSQGSILTELEETRRLVQAFDTIDTSMTEARDKLKVREPT